jgi:hypothetical protein
MNAGSTISTLEIALRGVRLKGASCENRKQASESNGARKCANATPSRYRLRRQASAEPAFASDA